MGGTIGVIITIILYALNYTNTSKRRKEDHSRSGAGLRGGLRGARAADRRSDAREHPRVAGGYRKREARDAPFRQQHHHNIYVS